jgi:hypothetical protein
MKDLPPMPEPQCPVTLMAGNTSSSRKISPFLREKRPFSSKKFQIKKMRRELQ